MKTLSIDLSELTQHIHKQYERILYSKTFENRICYCRKQIFQAFTLTVEKLLLKLGARTLKFLEDYDFDVSTDFSDVHEWFNREVYATLYQDPMVSNKTVLLFESLQKYQDKKFFGIIEEKYELLLQHIRDSKIVERDNEISELLEEIRAWFELFVYMLLATQFNCLSLSDKFLDDFNIPQDMARCQREKGECLHHNQCSICQVHQQVLDNGEVINIIMNDEFIDDMTWLDIMTTIVTNYHTREDNVTLRLDYRMYDSLTPCKLSHEHYEKILAATDVFKHFEIVNYEGIDFNGFHQEILEYVK